MADEFNLTQGGITVTAAAKQALVQALDVSEYDQADAVLVVNGHAASMTNAAITLLTGMQKESEDGWVTVVTWGSLSSDGTKSKQNTGGLLKFLRWEVTSMGGASSINFSIAGMLRGN